MPDTIGTIEVPEVAPSGTFPLRFEYPHAMAMPRQYAFHRFASANAKTEQRFLTDEGSRRWRAQWRLSQTDHDALVEFWEARQGAYEPFTVTVVDQSGATEDVTVRFADLPLTVERMVTMIQSGCEFVEQPTTFPTYTVDETNDRFPGAVLNTAVTHQVNEFIPLVKIEPLEAGYPPIYVSNRRCTIGGQLYLARLIDIPTGIGQRLGYDADQTTMVFGNADGVMTALSAAVNLQFARVSFSAYHVQSQVLWNGWKGKVIDTGVDKGASTFELRCSDPMYELNLLYPEDTLSENCRNRFNDGGACPWATEGGIDSSFPDADSSFCDKGFHSPNGCRAHQMDEYFGGILIQPQSVRIKDDRKQWITQTSRVSDSAAGVPLQEHYGLKARPVKCQVVEARDENVFFNAMGIVGRGELDIATGTFDNAGNPRLARLDGQTQHGYPSNVGLRFVRGTVPAGPTDFFSLGQSGDQTNGDPLKIYSGNSTFLRQWAAGVSFADIRRLDEKGIQLTTTDQHEMEVPIDGGAPVWVWTGPGTRTKVKSDSPIWITLFVYLRRKGYEFASATDAETLFDLDAAIACDSICQLVVNKIIGAGTERQFTFDGTIAEQQALRDWVVSILNTSLCDFIFSNGKLKFIIRADAAAAHSFTAGNVVMDTLQVAAKRPAFNRLTVQFADADQEMIEAPPLIITADDHIDYLGQALDSSFALVGAATRSLAARIGGVRVKEELGGATLAEWLKARDVSWRSTALALGVEVGQGASIEDSDIPDGAGLFRVLGWRLNISDWSIDFSGTTITDSMYDTLAGPKAADVPSNNVPAERFPLPLRSAWFPHGIAPRSDDAVFEQTDETFDLVQTYDSSADGFTKIANLAILGRLPVNGYKGNAESPIIRTVTPAAVGGALEGETSYWAAVCARDAAGNYSPPSPIRRFALPAGATWQVTFSDIDWPAGTWADGVLFVGDAEVSICEQLETLGSLPASFVLTGPLKQSTIGLPNQNNKLVCVRRKQSIHSGVLRFQVDDVNTAGNVVVEALVGLGDDWTGRIVTLLCDISDGSTPPLNFEVSAYNDATGEFTLNPDPVTVGLEPGDVLVVRCTPSTFTDFTIGDAGLVNGLSAGLIVDGEIGAIVRGITPGRPHQLRRVVSNTSTVYTVESAWDFEPLYFIVEDPNWSTPIESSAMDVFTSEVDVTLQMPLPNLLDVVLVVGGFIRDARSQETAEGFVVIREVWISGSIGEGITEPPAGDPGEEYADLVTGLTASVEYGVNEGGDQTFAFRGSWTEPTDERYRGGVVYARPVGGTSVDDRILATCAVGDPNFATDFWPVPFDAIDWDIFVTSYDRTGRRNSIQVGLTPQVTVTVDRQIGAAGQENAPFVSGFTASVTYGVNEAGDQTYSISGSWTLPADLSKFRGVVIIHRLGGVDRVLATENEGSTSFKTDSWPVPFTPESPTVYAVSADANNRRNSITGSTPSQALGPIERQSGAAGQEYAALVTGVSASIVYSTDAGGNPMFRFEGAWTLPVDRTKFRGVRVIARPIAGGDDHELATEMDGAVIFKTTDWPVYAAPTSFSILFLSIDGSNRINTVTGSTPIVTPLTVERQLGAGSQQYAPHVIGFTCSIHYGVNEAGDQVYWLKGNWTNPVSDTFRGVFIIGVYSTNPSHGFTYAKQYEGADNFVTGEYPVPMGSVSLAVFCISAGAGDLMNGVDGTTPSVGFTLTRQSGATGQEYAALVTGVSASIVYSTDAGGNPMFRFEGGWTLPVDRSKFRGVRVIARPIAGGDDHELATEMDGAVIFKTSDWPVYDPPISFSILFLSIDASNRINTVTGSTPIVTPLTVERLSGPPAAEVAPQVTGFTCAIHYAIDEAGDQIYWLTGSWTNPVSPKFKGVYIHGVYASVPTFGFIFAKEFDGAASFRTQEYPIPTGSDTLYVFVTSADAAGRSNSVDGTTPSATFTLTRQSGASGQEYAPLVTSGSVSLNTRTGEAGQQQFNLSGAWSLPAVRDKFRGVKVVYRTSGAADRILATETDGKTTFNTDWWDIPDSNEAFTIYLLSIDANNRVNTITGSTPTFTGTVTKSTGTLKIGSRALAAELGPGTGVNGSNQLYIPNGSVQNAMLDTVNANKLIAGTVAASISLTSPTITSPSITSTSGSNQITITGAQIQSTSSTSILQLSAGNLTISMTGFSSGMTASSLNLNDSSSALVVTAGSFAWNGGGGFLSRSGTGASASFDRLRWSGQLQPPYIADPTLSLAGVLGKIPIYTSGGSHIGYIPIVS